MSMNSIVHLILHHLEEESCRWRITIVIDSCRIDVRQFLIEPSLRKTNLTNLCQQVFKVVLIQERSILHSFPVQHITTNGVNL